MFLFIEVFSDSIFAFCFSLISWRIEFVRSHQFVLSFLSQSHSVFTTFDVSGYRFQVCRCVLATVNILVCCCLLLNLFPKANEYIDSFESHTFSRASSFPISSSLNCYEGVTAITFSVWTCCGWLPNVQSAFNTIKLHKH